jgi:hypothetical protein
MTPAENPRAVERNLVLVRRVKNASALPMPVDNPANNVNPKANKRILTSMDDIFFVTAMILELNSQMRDFKFIPQDLLHLLPYFSGLLNRQVLCKIHMAFEMNLLISKVPDMDVMNIFDGRE